MTQARERFIRDSVSSESEIQCSTLNFQSLGLLSVSPREFCVFSGNACLRLHENSLPRLDIDGSRYVRLGDGRGRHVEIHWGVRDDMRYILSPKKSGEAFGESLKADGDGRVYGDKHYRGANGGLEIIYHQLGGAADYDKPRRLRFSKKDDAVIISSPGATRPSDTFSLCLRNGKIEWAQGTDYSGRRNLFLCFSREAEIESSRKVLLANFADRSTDSWSWAKLQTNLMRIETERLDQIQRNFEASGRRKDEAHRLAVGQVSSLYNELGRLLNGRVVFWDGAGGRKSSLAAACAEQIIDHAANPSEINQGSHPTCTVASLENRIYSRYPAAAARLVVDLSTRAHYSSTLSRTLTCLDADSIQAHSDARAFVSQDRERGIASQIFALGAVNLIYALKQAPYRYRQLEASGSASSGDQLLDITGVLIDDCPRVNHNDLLAAADEITGRKEAVWIAHAGNFAGQKSIALTNAADLEGFVQKNRVMGNLPLAIHVYSEQEPLYTESGCREAKKAASPHLLVLRGSYNDRLEVDNQWGSSNDHLGKRAMGKAEVFQMMKNPYWLRIWRSWGLQP